MPVAVPKQTIEDFSKADTPLKAKFKMLTKLGDLSGVEVMFNMVLVAIYIRHEKTAGGVIRPQSNVEEDVWQGKAGLVVKCGPKAFLDDAINDFAGQKVDVGDWCAFRVIDSFTLMINDVPCRLMEDSHIKLRLKDPSMVL